jgi:uncharacterized protein (TIRG00374 family)
MRRTLTLLAKAALSVVLLFLSLRWVNVATITGRLHTFEPLWMLVAVVLLTGQTVLLAERWRQIASACAAKLEFKSSLQITFIATFFNQVLPSTVGGDAVRIWLLARKGGGWAPATYSVLIDRVVGVFVLALIVLACLPWTLVLVRAPVARAALLIIAFGAIAAPPLFLLLGARFQEWFDRRAVTRHVSAAARTAVALCRSRWSITTVILCSVVIQMLTVAAAWSCIKAVAAPVSFAQVLFLMPPVLLVSTVPISIAGWGVRESTMVAAFASAGLMQSDGLMLSLLFGGASFLVGLVGGVVWLASGLRVQEISNAASQPIEGAR